jgi:beta-lactamase regulating signal transducer with metallopeptidase domain
MTTFIETLNHWGDHFLKFAWPMLWQSSLLIAVIFVLEFALRRKIRAAIRYALWLVVLVKLLLPPSLALPTSPTWWIHPAAPPPVKAPPVSFTVSYGEQMAPDFPLPPSPVIPPPRAPAMSFAAWTLAASGVVSAGLLAWLLVRWRQINQKVRRARTSETLIPVLDEARRLTRLRPGIRLKLTEDSMSPAVCGLFRPVILLPQSLVEKLSAGQLRAVLLHEAIHLRRGDVWVNCAQALLQIVYWWHPLLWLANTRIRRVREEAVDDAVMLALRDDAEIYAPTLLEVAKLAFNRPLASLGLVGILESRSALRQRIERLMDFNVPKKAGLTVVSILGILAISAVALPMGEAPEQANAPTPILQPHDNGPSATNVVDSKIEADKLVQNGKLLYEKAHFREAETNFNQALKLDPENPRAFYYLSLVKQVIYPRDEHNGTNSVADSRVQVPNAWSPEVGIGLPVPNPYGTNKDIHTSPEREINYRKLNSLRLESISWSNGLPLSEVIRYLAEQSKLRDPDKKGIQFLFNPNVDAGMTATNAAPETENPNTINVKLVMNDASLHDVLDAVVRGADHPIKYSIEDYAVVISPKPSGPQPPTLEMRVFKVDTNTFASGLRGVQGLQTNNVSTMAQSLFSKLGVDLSAPGRSIAINDRLGLLFVRATPSELDTIERIIQALNQVAPQIHIKARFIEVPKKGFVMPTTLTNKVAGQMTGILTDEQARTVLRMLKAKPGAETLAEPEAVTTSGRQTQMRATTIITVVTNFALQENATNGSSSVVPQMTQMDTGPTLDVVPYVLSDGYTINLTVIPSLREFLGYDKPPSERISRSDTRIHLPMVLPKFEIRKVVATLNLWDGQTVVLGGLPENVYLNGKETTEKPKADDKELLIFITATIVDPAGNRVHSDDELPFNPNTIPPQPKISSPSP